MKKLMNAMLCTAMLATTPMQAAPSAPKLMQVIGSRTLAHMQSRSGITTCVLAVQAVTAALLLREHLSSRITPIVVNPDGTMVILNLPPLQYLGHLVGYLFPPTLGVSVVKNGDDAEKARWIASVQRTIAKTDGALAINLFLLSGIALRKTVKTFYFAKQQLQEQMGDNYDYEQKVYFEEVAIDTLRERSTEQGQPQCCICEGFYEPRDMNPWLYTCTSHQHIAHVRCMPDLIPPDGPACPVSDECELQIKRRERSRLEKLRILFGEPAFSFNMGVGVAVTAGFAGFGAYKAHSAYKAYRATR